MYINLPLVSPGSRALTDRALRANVRDIAKLCGAMIRAGARTVFRTWIFSCCTSRYQRCLLPCNLKENHRFSSHAAPSQLQASTQLIFPATTTMAGVFGPPSDPLPLSDLALHGVLTPRFNSAFQGAERLASVDEPGAERAQRDEVSNQLGLSHPALAI